MQKEKSAQQIREKKQDIKYDTRDYVIDYLYKLFKDDDMYIPPEYQRNFIWSEKDKCNFIESVLMGLPIPLMFFADADDGRIEIVDGAQRTSTLVAFLDNQIKLDNLAVLNQSNGLYFDDLDKSVQRRFKQTSLRVVYLDQGTTVSTRQEIFRRINESGKTANAAEIRRGSRNGLFSKFLCECVTNKDFNTLAPRSEMNELRYEGLELVSRFFAYLDSYENNFSDYSGKVSDFIDSYVDRMDEKWEKESEEATYNTIFLDMLDFSKKFLGPLGFRKSENGKSTPRARFEALSIGIALALKSKGPNELNTDNSWLLSDDFLTVTKSDAANNKSNLSRRINFVKNKLENS